MSFTLTSSGAIIMKAGANASSTATSSGALLKEFADQAEADICSKTRYDWVTNYTSLGTNFKKLLDCAVSSKAASFVINYDMSGYTSRQEASGMLNILWTDYQEALNALKDAEVRRAIGAS